MTTKLLFGTGVFLISLALASSMLVGLIWPTSFTSADSEAVIVDGIARTQPLAEGPFRFGIAVTYPSKLRWNQSAEVALKYSFESGDAWSGLGYAGAPLGHEKLKATLLAPAFDVEEAGNSSSYTWVITPKNDKLGKQTVVIVAPDKFYAEPPTRGRWVQDPAAPEVAVSVSFTVNGKFMEDINADRITLPVEVLTVEGLDYSVFIIGKYFFIIVGALLAFPLAKEWILFRFGPPKTESNIPAQEPVEVKRGQAAKGKRRYRKVSGDDS